MGKKRTIVEINGRMYDAATGQIVSDSPGGSRVIDGFSSPIHDTAVAKKRSVNQAKQIHHKPQKTKKLHTAAAQNAKPKATVRAKATTTQKVAPALATELETKVGYDAARAERAQSHKKSAHIKKFKKVASITVTQETTQPTKAQTPDLPPLTTVLSKKPTHATQPSTVAATANQPSEPKKLRRLAGLRKSRPKLIPTTAVVALVVALGGFYVYRNIPGMALQIASSRAGIAASLPGYNPTGYTFTGPVSYSEGIISLEFASSSDDRVYTITQKESSWDSQSLLNNYVKIQSEEYLTFQEQGLTVYTFNNSAAWVDGGIWYLVEGNSLMTNEQLLKIATSL